MVDGGIISQFGFEYQKTVFLNIVIKNMTKGAKFNYEFLDDASFSIDDNLTGTRINNYTLIQCKTGEVKFETLAHVFSNWLAAASQSEYCLYSENEVTCKKDFSSILRKICSLAKEYEITNKSNKNSVLYKIKTKYNLLEKFPDYLKLGRDLKSIYSKHSIIENNCDILDNESKETFVENECDGLLFDAPKNKRYEAFCDKVILKIRDAILKKKPFEFDFTDYSIIIEDICQSINDQKYELDFFVFKAGKESLLDELKKTREGVFLSKIYNADEIIAKYLIAGLYYQDMRNFYIDSKKENDVFMAEYSAHTNYLEVSEEDTNIKEIFKTTINKKVESKIIVNNTYNNGCYIYLSSDDAPEDKYIDWCGENAKE